MGVELGEGVVAGIQADPLVPGDQTVVGPDSGPWPGSGRGS